MKLWNNKNKALPCFLFLKHSYNCLPNSLLYDSAEMILDNCRLVFECNANKIETVSYKSGGKSETIKYEND